MTFAERLREYRERAGMSQLELAERSGVARAYINMLESGKRENPGLETVQRLARGLGIDVVYLVRDLDESEQQPTALATVGA